MQERLASQREYASFSDSRETESHDFHNLDDAFALRLVYHGKG